MRKIIILLFTLILISCEHTINDIGIVEKVEINSGSRRSNSRYYIRVNMGDYLTNYITIRTDHLYQVGDTVRLVK